MKYANLHYLTIYSMLQPEPMQIIHNSTLWPSWAQW